MEPGLYFNSDTYFYSGKIGGGRPLPLGGLLVANIGATSWINLRTTISPSNKVFAQAVVIVNGKARSLDELDRWRLFDVPGGSVTYVDDVSEALVRLGAPKPGAGSYARLPRRELSKVGDAIAARFAG